MPVLYAWARNALKVIELGVRSGNSTAAFLAALEGRGHLWSVDIDSPKVPEYWHNLPWSMLVADDVTPEAVAWCPGDVDVLFIDTSHSYEHTLTELRLYVPKVRAGGVVLMHDTRAGGTVFGPGWPGVPQALNEFCAETGLSWYEHPGSPQWSPGIGIIEIPGE
jgi:predicted O-methyltransferase YrrM